MTVDELGDPHDLRLRTYVNDELRQDSNHRGDDLQLLSAGRPSVSGVHVGAGGIGELRNTVVEEPDGFVVPANEEVPQWAH